MTERKGLSVHVKDDLGLAIKFIENLRTGKLTNGEGGHGKYSDLEFIAQVNRVYDVLSLAVAGFKGEISEVTG